jgi:hypothetical protein
MLCMTVGRSTGSLLPAPSGCLICPWNELTCVTIVVAARQFALEPLWKAYEACEPGADVQGILGKMIKGLDLRQARTCLATCFPHVSRQRATVNLQLTRIPLIRRHACRMLQYGGVLILV